ncbi:MAG TPA: hypothetical protein VFL60_01075 [Gaiellaceae bacterium]|nr:hypothetical protein [Gaiellaceae bacterium]
MLPDLGSTQDQVAVVVGFFLPLLLSIPIQSRFPEWARTLIAVGGYAVAGLIINVSTGAVTGQSYWQTTLTALTLGVVGYQGVWKPSGIAPSIRGATDVGAKRQASPARPAAKEADADGHIFELLLQLDREIHQLFTAVEEEARVR